MTSKLIEHLFHLAGDLGPRPATTSSERVASAYCASVFEDCGLETRAETFQGIRSTGWLYLPIAAATLVSGLIGTTRRGSRAIGAAIGALSLAAFYGEQTSRFRPMLKILARRTSYNAVGILRPKGVVRRKVVVISHVDTSRRAMALEASAAGHRRNVLFGVCASIAALLAHFLPRRLRRVTSTVSSLALAGGLGAMIERELRGAELDGANQSASGTAVLLALAEELAEDRLEHTEMWFVSTAGREAGRGGMSGFMDRNGRELDGALFLGIEGVATPRATVRWITHSGLHEVLNASPELIAVAEEASGELPHLKAEPGVWMLSLETDVAAVRGQRAMTIKALQPDGTIPAWQTREDTFENVDEDVLERSYLFALGILRSLDRVG